MWFLFKILHVRGRNTCLYKGEMCFILLGGVLISFFFYTGLMTMLTYIVFIFGLYIFWCRFFHLALNVLFLFYLYTHISHLLYTIYYLCFTLRCRDEFCLKYFRNTGYQSLLAINSFLAKFFKSLYYDKIYYIWQVNMSWVIYDFSCMFICLLWFCHGLPKREIVKDIFCVIG